MVQIEHLEVLLEVDGDDDEAAFGRLFEKYVRRWHRALEEEKARHVLRERERVLHGAFGGRDEP